MGGLADQSAPANEGFVGWKVLTIPPSLVDTIQTNTLSHFLDLQEDEAGIPVAITVVLGQESDGLLLLAMGDLPTGGLGNEPDGTDDNNTGKALQDERNTPRVVVVDVVAAVGDSRSGDRTTEPAAVVETYPVQQLLAHF